MSTPAQRSSLTGPEYFNARLYEETGHPKTAQKIITVKKEEEKISQIQTRLHDCQKEMDSWKQKAKEDVPGAAEMWMQSMDQYESISDDLHKAAKTYGKAVDASISSMSRANFSEKAQKAARAAGVIASAGSAGASGAAFGTAAIPIPIVGTAIGAAAGAAGGAIQGARSYRATSLANKEEKGKKVYDILKEIDTQDRWGKSNASQDEE